MQQAFKGIRVLARAQAQCGYAAGVRALHSTAAPHAFSKFAMPAMSPTMTEGGLANWKVSEGSVFSAGDVLLEIETDKATMDVEAQDDGVLAKIIVQAGEKGVQVGKMIAILAEEGDDLSKAESEVKPDDTPSSKSSSAESPSSSASSSSSSSGTPAPQSQEPSQHTPSAPKPSGSTGHGSGSSTSQMFPSVSRLLAENNISTEQASQIKGSGIRGMLTKGDVLVHLGKASSPTGSYKKQSEGVTAFGGIPPKGRGPVPAGDANSGADVGSGKKPESDILSATELRSAILAGLAAPPARSPKPSPPTTPEQPPAAPAVKRDWLDGIL